MKNQEKKIELHKKVRRYPKELSTKTSLSYTAANNTRRHLERGTRNIVSKG